VPLEQWQLEGFEREFAAGAVKAQKAGARCWYEFDEPDGRDGSG
jgi:hypothetical protein